MSVKLPIKQLETRAPFKDLFPIDAVVLAALVKSIKNEGFDPERAIFAWKVNGTPVVVEGHMRLEAARKARLSEVPVVVRKFADEDEAFQFAIASQRDRRNLSKEEIATAIARAELARPIAEPAIGPRGGKPKDPATDAVIAKAAKAGVGERTARQGLANARAERKAPANAKPQPAPTMTELKDLQKAALAAARAAGSALTKAGRSDSVEDLTAAGHAALSASSTYSRFLKRLGKYIDSKEKTA
jgi:ParB-like chromosome segregation protein Spo0J